MKYIESEDCQQASPPYFFPKVNMTGCLLAASASKLQDWCDRFLNIGSTYHFQPLVPFVYICVGNYPQMFVEGQENKGFSSQDEYLVMVPLVRSSNVANFLLPDKLTWGFPFIGVTNGTSAISGQTVIGYPKLVGSITRNTAPDGSFTATVTMPGFPQFTSKTPQAPMLIITVNTGPKLADLTPLAFPWSLITTGDVGTNIGAAFQLLTGDINPGHYSATMLKQIRDAQYPTEACYQSLISAEMQLLPGGTSVQLANGTVDIVDNASVDIAATLGLLGGVPTGLTSGSTPLTGGASQQGQRFTTLAAFTVETDMRFSDVINLSL